MELDQNYNADLLDAMADIAYEQEQAMFESLQNEWSYVDQDFEPNSTPVEHPLICKGD